MKSTFFNATRILFISVFVWLLGAPTAFALVITDSNAEIRNDFLVEPARIELTLKPGESVTRALGVVNRTEKLQEFLVEVEDFTGSRDLKNNVVLHGSDKSPYTIKDFIRPEVESFRLKPKQRAELSVNIAVPPDAEPGGRYASVLVSIGSSDNMEGETQARTVSRIGALFLVRVAGEALEEGRLADFRLSGEKSAFRDHGPYNFEVLFENNGNVHLAPSGHVHIANMFGKEVKTLDVPPFFSLPDSLRAAEAKWEPPFAFGRYTATVELQRGYQSSPDQTDTRTITFWVLPWKILLGILIAIAITAAIIRTLIKNYEIRRKG